MRINRLKISNYKGFHDSGWLEFKPGFNVVVGQNNAGKTALLEAFRLNMCVPTPYRSIDLPRGTTLANSYTIDFDLSVTGDEITIMTSANNELDIPIPVGNGPDVGASIFSELRKASETEFLMSATGGGILSRIYPSHRRFPEQGPKQSAILQITADRQGWTLIGPRAQSPNDTIPALLAGFVSRRIYVFSPERLNVGRTPAQESSVLTPNASNLAAVLMHLKSNPNRFNRFNALVSTIFPTVRRIEVVLESTQLVIRIWSVDTSTERDDLAVSLEHSGTGLGQVLAILCVVMTTEQGVIVIDEPNSFLHPGAAKKLISILSEFKQHQYVISTHSPELVAVANPSVMHMVRWLNGQSVVEQMDRSKIDATRRLLLELGVSASDTFGAERVIWVEGQTEQICFPIILKAVAANYPPDVSFIAVTGTGDFDGRKVDAKKVVAIYDRLSTANSLLPVSIAFSFDRELRSVAALEKLRSDSRGRVQILGRRTYENYLISGSAIAAVISSHIGSGKVTADEISEWIVKNSALYEATSDRSSDLANWSRSVNAPAMLAALFTQVTGARLEFSKTTHSVALTEWLLKNDRESLGELIAHVEALLPAS